MTSAPDRASFWLVALFVGVSGFCSLIYQVVWERAVRYSFGGDSISAAIVTATFLLGLGVGAVAFGRWRRHAFSTFALVQIAIGAYAIASYPVLAPLARILGRAFGGSVADADGIRPIVVVACVLFLLPPCILIGGTTPLMFNCFIRPGVYAASAVGLLYGLNTAGAAFGVLAAPFVFLNRLSLSATLSIVGAGNLVLGLAIWLHGRRIAPAVEAETSPEGERPPGDAALLALAFASGFVSLAFEVSLFRAFFTLNPSSAYNFPAVLMPFLLAVALGSVLWTRFGEYSPDRSLRRIGWLIVGSVVAMLVGVVLAAGLLLLGVRTAVRHQSRLLLLLLYGGILAVPLPLLLGGVLPLLMRLASGTARRLPRESGRLYLSNSVGAFAGAMLTQFIGLPLLGTRGVVITLVLIGLSVGGWCLARGRSGPRARLLPATLVLVVAVVALLVPAAIWDAYTFGTTGEAVDRVEGVSGVAVIRWHPSGGRVYVNGQYMSSLPDDARHVQLVSFALSLARRERVLVLGLGAGGLVRELVRDPGVRRVDVVDWSHELPRLLESPRARALLADALRDPKVKLCRCDARVAVSLYEAGSFDVVIDDLAEANWVGATSIKSAAYFRQLARILQPAGVLVYRGNWGDAREPILAGLLGSFRVVREHERGVVLCSDAPLAFDRERAERVLVARERILAIPRTPYAEWLIEGLRPVSADELGGAAPIRDDLLVHEYRLDPLRARAGDARRGGESGRP